MPKRAVVLLSGGIDSATCLYLAKKGGFIPYCLSFDYGQRHRREIESAKKIARKAKCKHLVCKINFPWKGSSLIDRRQKVPKHGRGIPSTYIPARNTIFLSFALSFAETIKAEVIFIGANAVDFSGYPDCRPKFYRAFKKVISCGTKAGVEKREIRIKTPLIRKTKAQIIQLGKQSGVLFELTWSCYRGGSRPCGFCDSCRFRAKGFREAGVPDPLL